jgi:putative tryptophan/tyrosine transport system substrate-binding protein
MRRRDFIAGLGAASWPFASRAQQADRMRRVGVLVSLAETDPVAKADLSSFTKSLAELGWSDGRLRTDVRWAAGDVNRMRILAKELVGLQPDVILAHGTPVTAALQKETRTIPIVFVAVADPVGPGFVASLSRPGGNLTGFIYTEAAMTGKWLELLMEIAPGVKRVSIMFNPDTAAGSGTYFPPMFEAAARSLKLDPLSVPVHNNAEIEMAIASLGRGPGGGLVVMNDAFMGAHRAAVILLAARNSVPTVYTDHTWVRDGGLLSYGADVEDLYRRAAPYVDRILRGGKPAELPVQLPTKFEMALNVKAAKALGLAVPQSILLRTDEVIE